MIEYEDNGMKVILRFPEEPKVSLEEIKEQFVKIMLSDVFDEA